MLFDSSVWIDFLTKSNDHKALMLQERMVHDENVYICSTIIQEVLQGIRNDNQFKTISDLLLNLEVLAGNEIEAAVGAATIYRKLRKKGITIRKPNDCLIAWYAITYDLTLAHNDQDFKQIALHTPLKLYQQE